MCLKFRECISNLGIFEWMKQFGVCSWTIVCGPCFAQKVMRNVVNHPFHKTQTIIGTVRGQAARPQTQCLIILSNYIKAESECKTCMIETVLCVGEAWASKLSKVWDPTTSIHNCVRWKKFKHSWIPRKGMISKKNHIHVDVRRHGILDRRQVISKHVSQMQQTLPNTRSNSI